MRTPPTLEDLRRNPDLLEALQAEARLARSRYVHGQMRNLFDALRPRTPVALRTALGR